MCTLVNTCHDTLFLRHFLNLCPLPDHCVRWVSRIFGFSGENQQLKETRGGCHATHSCDGVADVDRARIGPWQWQSGPMTARAALSHCHSRTYRLVARVAAVAYNRSEETVDTRVAVHEIIRVSVRTVL